MTSYADDVTAYGALGDDRGRSFVLRMRGEGVAEIAVGDQRELVSSGGVAFAGDGVPHSVRNPGPGRLIVMAILAPPPK